MSAFFVSVISSLISPLQASERCESTLTKEKVSVRYVYDGDTLQLSDRRKVRLVGLNTPELKEGPAWSRFVAKQAKSTLQQWLSLQQNVYLQVEQDARDDYGRILGYLVNAKGEDPAVALLEKGLAYAVVIAPNIEKQRCYFAAEKRARLADVGVWAQAAVIRAKNLNKKLTGFSLVQGKVTRQFHFKTSEAVVLDDNLVVMLKGVSRLPSLAGKEVRVRGWVQARKFTRDAFSTRFTVYLNHMANVEIL
ncbi:thermonuclease family protein [Neptunomonas qingdaonensis]|uniref:Nuclease homologue n=1 Tax=Neptunomonas qingdaonensis TaxID=1045558 RepID=A0A1I2MB65_9GAMM|nr:thermonuclease family protein [Neptunomonas qingdaonensis]SFF86451.1 nuclease homologue [Neptunomonas qingdaonensis]